MSFSIYASIFNAEKMKFDWKGALQNWVQFLDRLDSEIVIAVNKSEDNTAGLLRDYAKEIVDPRSLLKVNILDVDIPYTDPEFDGKAKAAALAAATKPFAIQLDCDERLDPRQRQLWVKLAYDLERSSLEGYFVPVVDLIGDEKHYKSIGSKVYLHRNLPYITRGVVKWAYREDGSIDKTKSDTCDCIRKGGELIKAEPILMPGLPDFLRMGQLESGHVPFVYHLGWLDKEQRLCQSAFWRPVWDLRDKQSQEPELTVEKLEAMRRLKHNLMGWKA